MLGIPVLFETIKVLKVESDKAADSHEPQIQRRNSRAHEWRILRHRHPPVQALGMEG